MKFDVVFVTYNSTKWLQQNMNSILKSDYNLKNISLYYVDNNSKDETVNILKEYEKKYSKKFNEIKIIESKTNLGFGRGNNKGALLGKSDYIFFLNIDTEIEPDTFKKLEKEIKENKEKIGIWELRQKPYEHPKYYDPVTGYTTWSSGACFVMPREVFNKTKGFDKHLFMYCEDVELSWHTRQLGYKIKYLYDISITHYSYAEPNQFKENQFIFAYVNNLYLRAKYGNLKKYLKGHLLCLKSLRYNLAYTHVSNKQYKPIRKRIAKEYFKVIFKSIPARIFKHTHNNKKFNPQFINDLDYEITRLGSFYTIDETLKSNSLVSIIVRTCGRPNYLREALISLRNQSYKNIEIVIIEDGKNISEQMIKKEFSDLNIKYKATGKKLERSVCGNIGLKMATGKYLNFLDDDDVFYPEHVEVLLKEMEKNNADIVYSTGLETATNIISKDPYIYDIKTKIVRNFGKFSRLRLYENNITPIQCVMFKKEVFENCGGLDENITALEDWDLWIRFSLKYNFHYIEKTTSVYRVPFNNEISSERQKFLNSALDYVISKYDNNKISVNLADIFWKNK